MNAYTAASAIPPDYDDPPSPRAKVPAADPSRLAPSAAFYATQTTPRANGAITKEGRRRVKRTGSKRLRGPWKKLLWVKQSYPDNYTDEATFLDHMQRNPQFQQYEFWSLVGSSAVIVQHVCSVVIFVCCFAGIVQERLSPVVVASTGSLATVLGWALWDYWVTQSEAEEAPLNDDTPGRATPSDFSSEPNGILQDEQGLGIEVTHPSRSTSASSVEPSTTTDSSPSTRDVSTPDETILALLSPRNRRRLATAKSAILIYCVLLGLSPILKSLTKSTTSDSIWAISSWLMMINVFFFDYSSSSSMTAYPAPLSTNAAIMSSTVLASRLTSTTHVFSLMLFSIEAFGLFPIFRRYLLHVSWQAHVVLTGALVLGAGSGIAVTITGGGWTSAVVGATLGSGGMGIAMATCAFWLIGLQKYKNEIHGPWDPARPIIRRRWD